MKTGSAVLTGAAALVLAAAPFALAQQQTINAYVREMIEDFADPGESLVGEIQLEEIDESGSAEFIFDIDPEKTYFVYSACDDDCSDIDLTAHDADEDYVDSDDEDDDTPFLMISPGDSGDELHVIVDLVDCDVDSCVIGVGLYEADE